MGKSKKKTTTSQTQNTSSFLDTNSRARINDLNGQADSFLSGSFQNFVQPLSDRENQARGLADQSVGSHAGLFDQSQDLLNSASAGVDRNRTVDVSRYTNPFEQQVIDANNADYAHGLAQNENNINARVALDGGYGSSGHALGLAEAFGQSERARNSQNASLRYDNYNQALERDYRDTTTQAGLAGQYAQLGEQRQAYDARDIGLLDALGTADRQIDQNAASAQYQDEWQRYQALLNERQVAGGLADRYGTSQSNGTTETVTRPSIGQTLGGIAGGIGGLFGSGAVSGISSLFGAGKSLENGFKF